MAIDVQEENANTEESIDVKLNLMKKSLKMTAKKNQVSTNKKMKKIMNIQKKTDANIS